MGLLSIIYEGIKASEALSQGEASYYAGNILKDIRDRLEALPIYMYSDIKDETLPLAKTPEWRKLVGRK